MQVPRDDGNATIERSVIRATLAEDDVVWQATDKGLVRYQPGTYTFEV